MSLDWHIVSDRTIDGDIEKGRRKIVDVEVEDVHSVHGAGYKFEQGQRDRIKKGAAIADGPDGSPPPDMVYFL